MTWHKEHLFVKCHGKFGQEIIHIWQGISVDSMSSQIYNRLVWLKKQVKAITVAGQVQL